jgi:pilus assembly protein FimV
MAIQRDKIVASAEKLVAKGKIEPAIKEYERLLDDNPNDVNTLNRIGDLWVRINRTDEAVKVYTRIADHYAKDGFFLKAIAIFKKINKLDPSRLDVYAKLADLYAKQGLAMEAKGQYQVLADYYLKHGDPDNALKTYQRIADLDPNSINVHVKLADLYSQNGKTGEALKEYDRVGRMLLKRGMTEEAVQVFRKALKIEPGNVELAESLANTLLEARDFANAQQILEAATDANPDSTKLIALLGKVYIAKGDVRAAESILSQGLAQHPGEQAIADLLSELFLRSGKTDSALSIIDPYVEAASQRGDRSAVEMLQRVTRIDAGHIPTLERLVQVYQRLNEETNILSSMNSLAEAHISRGDNAAATEILEALIRREPENAQHKEKLAFVRSRGGAAAAPPPPPPPPAAPAAAPPPAPEPEPAMEIEFGGDSLDFDLSAPLPPPPIIDEPPLVPSDEGEDIDFITEQLTEAEVFAKYGLTEKAIEHLHAVLERSPSNLAAFDKLVRIHLDEGNAEEVRTIGSRYLALLEEKGELEAADTLRSEIKTRGFAPGAAAPVSEETPQDVLELTIEPEDLANWDAPPPEVEIEPAPEPAFAEEPSIDLPPEPVSLEEEPEIEFDIEPPQKTIEPEIEFAIDLTPEPEAEPAFEPEPTPAPEAEAAPVDEPAASEPAIAPEEEFPIEELGLASEMAGELELEEELELGSLEPAFDLIEPEAGPVPEPAEPEPPPEPLESEMAAPFLVPELEEPPAAETPALEELGEIDFYVEQELWQEAAARLEMLESRFPDDPQLAARRVSLESARPAAAPTTEPDLLAGIREELDAVAAPAADESSLFDEEDDFFDLAAELEQELSSEEEPLTISEEEQSLEEIFKEFKRGVEQQLDAEDYDTHYNLGIAYKEMGLIDEAIGEFQLAAKDPKRMIECCSMLGLCFLEKGMPQLAIKWYQKGLEAPEITEEEHLGLLYDLGSAFLEVGDTQNAQKTFMEIYGINSNYRDIVNRIKQLEDVAP